MNIQIRGEAHFLSDLKDFEVFLKENKIPHFESRIGNFFNSSLFTRDELLIFYKAFQKIGELFQQLDRNL